MRFREYEDQGQKVFNLLCIFISVLGFFELIFGSFIYVSFLSFIYFGDKSYSVGFGDSFSGMNLGVEFEFEGGR